MNRIFVYGSLKKNYWNHPIISNHHENMFIGSAMTVSKYLLTDVGFPYMVEENKVDERLCLQVMGEVYDVNDETMLRLNRLEGVDYGHYQPIKIKVICNETLLEVVTYTPCDPSVQKHQICPVFKGCYQWIN